MKFFHENGNNSFLKSLLFGVVIAYAAMAALVVIGALVMTFLDVSVTTISVIATAAISVAALLGGFMAAKRKGSSPLPIGLATGFVFYLTVAIVAAIVTKGSFSSLFILRMALCVVLAGVGAVLETFKKTKNGYI